MMRSALHTLSYLIPSPPFHQLLMKKLIAATLHSAFLMCQARGRGLSRALSHLFLTSASPLGQELGSLLLERELGSERQSNLSRDVQPEGEEKEEDKYPKFCRETITSAS